jgi:RHS repeat-associated protein
MASQYWRTLTSALMLLALVASNASAGSNQASVLDDIFRSRALTEPLIPFGPTSPPEDEALLRAIRQSEAAGEDGTQLFRSFLGQYPQSNWRAAILANSGLASYREGYFQRSIDDLSEAWRLGKSAVEPRQKALADRVVAELIEMHARLGHAHELALLLKEIEGRPIEGRAEGIVEGAKEGLYEMQHNPGLAYLCGPMAVKNVLLALKPNSPQATILDEFRSGPNGVDFATVEGLAHRVGLEYRKVRIANPGTELPLPAVVHWRVNHYAAVIAFANGRYEVKDPTFGSETLWIKPEALAAESDGYYLIPTAAHVARVEKVSSTKARAIFGMGFTSSSDMGATTTSDNNAGGCGDCCSCTNAAGMPVASAKALLASLNLTDTPLSYKPPKGPAMSVTAIYNHLDTTQPANVTYSSVGKQWGMNWIAFVQDNPTNASAGVTRVFGGGGYVVDGGCSAWDCEFSREALTGDILSRVRHADGSVVYTLTDRTGAQQVYAQSDGAASGVRRVFLSQIIDPQGNAATLNYDAQLRLTSVVDALGKSFDFAYESPAYPYYITMVADAFGRAAYFTYDGAGRLTAITDAIGLTSTFTYDDSSHATLITSMTTPYGTSNFAYQSGTFAGGDGNQHPYRILTLTDPRGYTQKVEYYVGDGTHPNVPGSDPLAQVPVGTSPSLTNQYLLYRNTFYWSAEAYRQSPNDFSVAKVYHFLHNASNLAQTSRAVESIKLPLQNRVWYTYQGQSDSLRTGTLLADPADVAVVVNNDGSRQSSLAHRNYNAQTNVSCYKDPVGRVTRFDYDANGIDRVRVRWGRSGANCSNTSGTYDVIAQYTYNNQHRPLTYTDAANQTTTYTYDSAGQLTSETNALGETTTYNRDPNSYLLSVNGPHGESLAAYTYDPVGRVVSETDAGGETIGNTWDQLNRLTRIDYPDGTARVYAYDRLDLQSVTDRLSHTTAYGYDPGRNRISATDPIGKTTAFSYDGNGLLINMLDASNRSTAWHRDVQGRLTAKVSPDNTSENFAYRPETGWLFTDTDALGQSTRFGYTVDGRIASIDYLNALTSTPPTSFVYDPIYPRIAQMTDGTGTSTYSYYPAGVLGANRLQLVQTPQPAAQIGYDYDHLGRVEHRTIDGVSETFGYDDLGRIQTDQNTLSNFNYTYLGPTEQVTAITPSSSPFKVTLEYLDNSDDRRLKTISNGTHGKLLQKFDYETNAEDQVSSVTAHDAEAVRYDYAYDDKDRLIEADASGYGAPRKRSYSYDDVDNLKQVNSGGNKASTLYQADFNDLNEIVHANGVSFGYDAAGELLSDGKFAYVWDAAHRLVRATDLTSGTVSQYVYDGVGRRVSIAVQSSSDLKTTNYLWCGLNVCQARDLGNAVLNEFFEQGETQGSSKFLYARDRLGSITGLIDPVNGTIKGSYAYDPWGNMTASTGSVSPSFGFAGMLADRSTGKYLTLYRVYDPTTARWISQDPMGLAAGFNNYAYVDANPLNILDLLGLGEENGMVCTINGPVLHVGGDDSGGKCKQLSTCLQQHEQCHVDDGLCSKSILEQCSKPENKGKSVKLPDWTYKQNTEINGTACQLACLDKALEHPEKGCKQPLERERDKIKKQHDTCMASKDPRKDCNFR